MTYDYIADELQEGESLEAYNARLKARLLLAEGSLLELARAQVNTMEMIKDMLAIIREFGTQLRPPKKQPTMTAFDLGWTATGV